MQVAPDCQFRVEKGITSEIVEELLKIALRRKRTARVGYFASLFLFPFNLWLAGTADNSFSSTVAILAAIICIPAAIRSFLSHRTAGDSLDVLTHVLEFVKKREARDEKERAA